VVLFYLSLARAEAPGARHRLPLSPVCDRVPSPRAFSATGGFPTQLRPPANYLQVRAHQTPTFFGLTLPQIWLLGSKIEFVRVFPYVPNCLDVVYLMSFHVIHMSAVDRF